MINPQIGNPQIRKLQNTAQLCTKTALKVVFVNVFMYKFESEHLYL